jgi:hypothetical protein
LVWGKQFFFSNRNNLYQQYKEFFGVDEQNQPEDNEGVGDTTKMGKKEAAFRYYFSITFNLAGEDITKINQIDELPLLLCLNTASLMKERMEKQREEMKKMEKQFKK